MRVQGLMRRARGNVAGRRLVAVGVLALIAVMLSACVEVNQNSTIKQDFTGTTNMRVGISLQALALVGSVGNSLGGTANPRTPSARSTPATSTDPFADLKKQVTQLGGTSQDYKNDKFQGVDTAFQFKTLDEMTTQINTVLGSSSSLSNPAGTTGTTSTSSSSSSDIAKLKATATANGVRIEGHIDPLSTLSDPSNSTVTGGFDPKLFGSDGYVQLSFTMPGKITAKDTLAKTDKSTVTWNFKVGDKAADIFVESDKSGGQAGSVANAPAGAAGQSGATPAGTGSASLGGKPVASTSTSNNSGGSHTGLIIGLAIAAIVVLGGAGLFFGLRGRGSKQPIAATAAPGAPPSPYGPRPGPYGAHPQQQYGAPSPYGQQPYPGQPQQPPQQQPPYGGYPPQPGQPPGAYDQPPNPPQPQQPQQPPYGGYAQPPQGSPYGPSQQPPYPGGYGQPPQGQPRQPPQQGGYPPQYPPSDGQGQQHGGQFPPPPRGPEPPR